MATPNLALIPSAYKARVVYSVLPNTGAGDFTFVRSGNATRINKDGLIETVDSHVPRLNYDLYQGKPKQCPSLLLEPSRTNLFTYSEDFSQDWLSGGAGAFTITPNSEISPDGTQNASKLITSVIGSQLRQNKAIINTQMSNSFYMRTNQGTRQMSIRINDNEITQTFTVTSEWKRYTVSGLVGGTLSGSGRCSLNNLDILDENNHVYIWGAQLEEGSYPTSYIPTNGSAETRNAEVANESGSASTFNDSEGVLMAEISALADDSTNRQITLSDGTDTNRLVLKYDNQSNVIQGFNRVNGSETAFLSVSVTDITLFSKCLLKYKPNDYALWINGFELATDTSSTTFPSSTLNDLKFGVVGAGSNFYGKTKQLQYFDSALTDSQLEYLTSYRSFGDMVESQNYIIQ